MTQNRAKRRHLTPIEATVFIHDDARGRLRGELRTLAGATSGARSSCVERIESIEIIQAAAEALLLWQTNRYMQ